MTGQLTPTITWHYWDGDEWIAISEYVLDDSCSGSWGMNTNRPIDRLATPGEMSMSMDNSGGKFDPDNANVLTGWAINTKVKLTITYDSFSKIAFYGHISDIDITDFSTTYSIVNVTVLDWMDNAYRFTINQQSIEINKRGDQVADTIVTATGKTPLATAYDVGDNEFPAAFDSMTVKTTAATELNKIVLSEGGYFYNRHDKVNGETLVFESASHRNGLHPLSKIPVMKASSGYILKAGSATDCILQAGSADKLILNQAVDASFTNAINYHRNHGENILNKITVTAYPKRTDTTEQILYSLGDVIKISSGETKVINVRYQNATTKENCNAITSLMIQPIATTDYLMNTKKDGTGTNITSDLTVSVVYRTAEAEITLTNGSAYTGKITFMRLRGYGVYQDSSIKSVSEDSASQTSYGHQELNIEQQYQRDTGIGKTWADKIMDKEKSPRTVLNRVDFIANNSDSLMFAFLAMDIGDMVKIEELTLELNNYYYINGVEFNISSGGVISYSWLLIEANPSIYNGGLTLIATEYHQSSTDIVDCGEIPALVDLPEQSVTAWVNINAFSVYGDIVCLWVDNAGGFECRCARHVDYGLIIALAVPYSGSGGVWISSYDTGVTLNNWACIGVSVVGETIKFYSRGILLTTIVYYAPIGSRESIDGAHYMIGNIRSTDPPSNYHAPFPGMLADIRHHNCILTDAEFAQVSADGIGGAGIKRGLLFQALCVKTADLAYFTNRTLTADDRLIENINGYLGLPNAGVVTRLIN